MCNAGWTSDQSMCHHNHSHKPMRWLFQLTENNPIPWGLARVFSAFMRAGVRNEQKIYFNTLSWPVPNHSISFLLPLESSFRWRYYLLPCDETIYLCQSYHTFYILPSCSFIGRTLVEQNKSWNSLFHWPLFILDLQYLIDCRKSWQK